MTTMSGTRFDPTARSARVVKTLHRVDPQFQALCAMLYGEDVEAEDVWVDVFAKRGPDSSELATRNRENIERRVAQASNVLGLTAGTAALGTAARDDRLKGTRVHNWGTKLGEARPTKGVMRQVNRIGPKKLAGAALGLQGANVAGDVVTSRVLGRSDKPERRKVNKSAAIAGAIAHAQREKTYGEKVRASPEFKAGAATKAAIKDAKSGTQNAVVRGFKAATKTTGRKIALAGGTLYVAGSMRAERKARANIGSGYDDGYYSYAKREEAPVESFHAEGEFSKLDTDQRLAFGWASVTEINGMPVVDRQADYVTTEEIEKAAYDYVLKSRVGGDMHKRAGDRPHHVSDLVESFVLTDEKIAKMGLPETTPRGWWVGFKIHDDEAWDMVKKGERTGFSIHGKGRREDIATDEAMGYR